MALSDQELLNYNHLGLIPGPAEEEEAFHKRAKYCLQLLESPPQEIKDPQKIPEESLENINNLFGIYPSWVPQFYSRKGIAPWHGGCLWIFQENKKTPTGAAIQLKNQKNQREILVHELAHVGRMEFEEPRYEEVLASKTSSSGFRRFFGSFFESANESWLFIMSLLLVIFGDLLQLVSSWGMLHLLKIIPIAFIAGGSIRVWNRQRVFRKCLDKVKNVVGEKSALPFVYRLTDHEIEKFSVEEIISYAKRQKSLRWRMIRLAFLH